VPDAVFYQIFPERFCNGSQENDPPGVRPWDDLPSPHNFFGGDLQGVTQKLDYLQDLGITALYLNPIFRAATNHKYDTHDYYQVDPAFGGNAALLQLVAECHRRGMRVILDGVFNHCGEGFFAFRDVKEKGAASPYAAWFTAHAYPLRADPLSYMVCGDAPYLPKLNHANPAVQAYLLDVARYWLAEAGIDGWRLDVPFKISIDFWQRFREVVKAANQQAYLVGEVWREAGPWVNGGPFDGVTNYRLRDLLLDYCLNFTLDAEDFAYELLTLQGAHGPAAAGMLNLLGSHDTARILTLLKGDIQRLRIALILLFTQPGAPLVYYGDEVGMLGENDPDCRRPMAWEPARQNRTVQEIFRILIRARKEHPAMRRANPEIRFAFNGVLAYRLAAGEDEAFVMVNPRVGMGPLRIPSGSAYTRWKDVFTGEQFASEQGSFAFEAFPARSARLLVPDR
jgi:glycosidase